MSGEFARQAAKQDISDRIGVSLRYITDDQVDDEMARVALEDAEFSAKLTETIVHILHHGESLCDGRPGIVPGFWPEGHKWVRVGDVDKATCKPCLTALGAPGFGGHR